MAEYKDFKSKHRTEWTDFLWGALIRKVIEAKNKDQAEKALNSLFSDYEKEVVTKRLAAMVLIREGKSYKEIGNALWLSPATISALKKSFFGNPENYKSQRSSRTLKDARVSKLIKSESWLDNLFTDVDIWKLLKNPPRPPGIGLKQPPL